MLMTAPSGFYESLDAIPNLKVTAICAGVRRSATTMIYQIVRDVIEEGGVVKTHTYLDVSYAVPVIATYRDFRDCAASWWQLTKNDNANRNTRHVANMLCKSGTWSVAVANCVGSGRDKMNLEDAIRIAALVKLDLFHLEQYAARRPTITLRYEDFSTNPIAIRPALEDALRRPIKDEIFERYSLKQNWGMKRFDDNPPEHWNASPKSGPIPDGHCHSGQSGKWKTLCDDNAAQALNDILRQPLVSYGYEQ